MMILEIVCQLAFLLVNILLVIGGLKNMAKLAYPWIPVAVIYELVLCIILLGTYLNWFGDAFQAVSDQVSSNELGQLLGQAQSAITAYSILMIIIFWMVPMVILISFVSWAVWRFIKNPGPYQDVGVVHAYNSQPTPYPHQGTTAPAPGTVALP